MAVEGTISSDTAISLATVLILLGASWRLSWLLSRIDSRTEKLPERVTALETGLNDVKGEMNMGIGRLQTHVENLEMDVNNLWAAYREDPPDLTRRERPPSTRPRKGTA